jgi:hypothetical protein
MPLRERNSFVRRQLLQPGWVNKVNAAMEMILSRFQSGATFNNSRFKSFKPLKTNYLAGELTSGSS